MDERIARIVETFLGREGHGIFTASLDLDYGGSSQGTPMLNLQKGEAAYRFVDGVLRATGAPSWEKVRGRTVIALIEGELVRGIKCLPPDGNRSFIFKSIYGDEGESKAS